MHYSSYLYTYVLSSKSVQPICQAQPRWFWDLSVAPLVLSVERFHTCLLSLSQYMQPQAAHFWIILHSRPETLWLSSLVFFFSMKQGQSTFPNTLAPSKPIKRCIIIPATCLGSCSRIYFICGHIQTIHYFILYSDQSSLLPCILFWMHAYLHKLAPFIYYSFAKHCSLDSIHYATFAATQCWLIQK